MARYPALNLLHTFTVAAKHLNVTRAAEELCLSQAAVSQQLRLLETQLEVSLFERTNRGLVLTPVGQQYLLSIKEPLNDIHQASLALMPEEKILRIVVDSAFAHTWLVKRLGDFRKRHTEFEIELTLTASLEVMTGKSLSNNADICVVYGQPPWPGYQAQSLITFREFPVCSPALLKRTKKSKKIELNDFTLIHERDHSGWKRWIEQTGMRNVDITQGPIVHDSLTCLRMAIEGQGMAIGDNLTCADFIKEGALVKPFTQEISIPESFCCLIKNEKLKYKAIELFQKWIIGELHKNKI
jgi:LysR family glycine cleavage system transcriptional activator